MCMLQLVYDMTREMGMPAGKLKLRRPRRG
jgi:hypothetical protein